ncbi:MAG: hypothetical protein ABI315_05215 [Bacteroidia bacterium]
MQQNKFYILFLLVIIFFNTSYSQDNFVLTSVSKSNLKTVRVKWYSKALLYSEGINLYRKESNATNWQKVNKLPIKKGDYKPTTQEIKEDKELTDYIELVNSGTQLDGVTRLALYVKTFKSEAFSRYLGIEYLDIDVISGTSLQYKVSSIQNGVETELGISKPITVGTYTEVLPPQKIEIIPKNKKTIIKWLPETSRYYGVNIYRMFDSTGNNRIKVNQDPVMISKTKNKKGEYEYPSQFYIEEKLKEDTTYYYSFKAIDFFGEESEFATPINVFVKDLNAPLPPIFKEKEVKVKDVKLKWSKSSFEKDFMGYNIYRAKGAGKEYTKVNSKLLVKEDTQIIDVVQNYGTYRYVIAAVDRSGNEGVTDEISIETIDEEPPSIPTGLVITADTGKIVLRWKKNEEKDIWGYLVYQTVNKNTNDDAYVLITPTPLLINEFKQELAKNSKNKFLYKVLAIDSTYNKSHLSAFAETTLPDVIAPTEPFIFNLSLDNKRNVVVEFFKNAELDLKGYELYRLWNNKDGVEVIEKINVDIIPNNATKYIDRTFDNEGIVKYYLIALDSANNRSGKSNIVKLNIRNHENTLVYEIKKFDVKQKKQSNNWDLNWKINKDQDIFYVVYSKQEGDENFEPQSKNLVETKFILNLSNTNKTLVQVRAYDTGGLVAKSEIKTIQSK